MNKLFLAVVMTGMFIATAMHTPAQVQVIIGAQPPVCQYGYYDYAPYACVDEGFYGPEYFYNGIFLGVGPWRNWGYKHGWGGHRFVGGNGGRYQGNRQNQKQVERNQKQERRSESRSQSKPNAGRRR
jgi:hypothetical protein